MCFALQQNKALATKTGTKAAVGKVTGKKDIFFFLFSCWGQQDPLYFVEHESFPSFETGCIQVRH